MRATKQYFPMVLFIRHYKGFCGAVYLVEVKMTVVFFFSKVTLSLKG